MVAAPAPHAAPWSPRFAASRCCRRECAQSASRSRHLPPPHLAKRHALHPTQLPHRAQRAPTLRWRTHHPRPSSVAGSPTRRPQAALHRATAAVCHGVLGLGRAATRARPFHPSLRGQISATPHRETTRHQQDPRRAADPTCSDRRGSFLGAATPPPRPARLLCVSAPTTAGCLAKPDRAARPLVRRSMPSRLLARETYSPADRPPRSRRRCSTSPRRSIRVPGRAGTAPSGSQPDATRPTPYCRRAGGPKPPVCRPRAAGSEDQTDRRRRTSASSSSSRRVVLPAPFGPTTACISPASGTRDSVFSARTSSKLTSDCTPGAHAGPGRTGLSVLSWSCP